MPNTATPIASGHATTRGRSDINSENGAHSASVHKIALDQRDGRHSMRQGADLIDERRDFDIGRSLMA